MLLSKRSSRFFDRLYRRLPFIGISFFLLALAFGLARSGQLKLAGVLVALLFPVEILYRWTQRLLFRNRRRWWADQRGGWWLRLLNLYVYLSCGLVALLIQSPFARYFILGLLVAGIICAGIIRMLNRESNP